ncbi:MAG: helix-turn-helix domain-containing protein [Chloroflexota bacterium]|nr:helix-turn-helix domain-containing protein [Chloroflexota bacterium]
MVATLGQLIRERRMELNLTQEELAERVGEGVRQSEISRLERNRVTLPRRQRMEQIAEALDIPIGVLLARSGWAGAETVDFETTEAAEAVPGEPVGERDGPDLVADASVPRPWDGPARDVYSDLYVSGNGDRAADEAPHLQEAILRAEALIGESESRFHEAQATIMQARQSVKRRHTTGS